MQRPPKARAERLPAALVAATRAQVANVLPELEQHWSANALGVQQRLTQAVERDDAASAQKWAIAGGISTEKVLLMKCRPTEIIANLHAHRHELGDIAAKLAIAASVQARHVLRGYAKSVTPVTHPSSTLTLAVKPALAQRDASGHAQVADIVDNR